MTTRVPRHEVRRDHSAEAMAPVVSAVEAAIAGLETSEDDRADALDLALGLAKRHCLLDPEADLNETWHAWVLAMQVGPALFAAGTTQEGPVACRVGTSGEIRKLPATGPRDYLHAASWLNAFYLTVICREEDRIDQLLKVPAEFLRASGAEMDDYVYDWIEALNRAWNGHAQTWDSLLAAVRGTAPEQTRIASAELMLQILYPPLELFQHYLRRDTEAFNKSLATALTWHKDYWTETEARSLSTVGLVALAPLAMACLAYDVGMPIEVESEYLPKYLLRGDWVGEFPT